METEKELIRLGMSCICSDEGKERADKGRAVIISELSLEDDHDITSQLVGSLWHDFRCEVTGMYCDMWFGVQAETSSARYFIPCDRVEDGLVSLWLHLNGVSQIDEPED